MAVREEDAASFQAAPQLGWRQPAPSRGAQRERQTAETRTVTQIGTNAQGQAVNIASVYEKQQNC